MWILITGGSSRRYASGEITSDIEKSAKRRWSSLRDGLRVVIFLHLAKLYHRYLRWGQGTVSCLRFLVDDIVLGVSRRVSGR